MFSISLSPDNTTFVSGACDGTAKLFDLRTNESIQTFYVSEDDDINAISFFPNGYGFGSGSDDATSRLFDIRADRELISYNLDTTNPVATTSVAFSHSGRYFFAGYDDYKCQVFDTLYGEKVYLHIFLTPR